MFEKNGNTMASAGPDFLNIVALVDAPMERIGSRRNYSLHFVMKLKENVPLIKMLHTHRCGLFSSLMARCLIRVME
jgi:hypothetical protein